jgi:hypothetical protein
MKMNRFGIGTAAMLAALVVTPAAADGPGSPRVGEVRLIALAPGNQDVVNELHQEGWLEARGQILLTAQYPALYRQLGRAWTRVGIPQDRFAIPRLRDVTQPLPSESNPYDVLGSGAAQTQDRVNRRQQIRTTPLSYWIFVGPDATITRQ